MNQYELKYLTLLSAKYPTIAAASSEIINLKAILNLPKSTEQFMSDIHGEYESFLHILKNGSGVIKRKLNDIYGRTLSENERKSLATIIYYPEQKLEIVKKSVDDINDWYKITLYRLVKICKVIASKYTRSKVRKALPKDFEYIIDELLHTDNEVVNKEYYYEEIIKSIIETERAEAFIIALSKVIQRLAVDHLHIIGDIFDRGPGADIILDALLAYHSVDIQWGNHDILWMGAAAGSEACIAIALNTSVKYNNMDTLEDGYGINIRPLATFALETYPAGSCKLFEPKNYEENSFRPKDIDLIARIHKAIAVIQFKLEAQIILRRPEYGLESRLMLDKIDFERGVLCYNGREYELLDKNFPTIDPANPFALSEGEREVMDGIKLSFLHSEKLQQHIRFLYSKGSMYKSYNANLLYHGCIPMNEDGSFTAVSIFGEPLSGRAYIDKAEQVARQAYFGLPGSKEREEGLDFLWYLWCGKDSPLFGKSKMATFERYLLGDKETHKEHKNPYYIHIDSKETCMKILKEFGLEGEESHIINGHVPVKIKAGESPIKAEGKLLVIDGGLSKAYQSQTGIAGYTLIYNSYGLLLASHEPFESINAAIEKETDIHSSTIVLEQVARRKSVADTDNGANIQKQIDDLQKLLKAYRQGLIKEKDAK